MRYRTLVLLAATALGCGGSTEPTWEGLRPGRFDLVLPQPQMPSAVSAPAGHPNAGECVDFQSGSILIDSSTELRLIRVFSVTAGVSSPTHRDTLQGTYDSRLVVEFGTHADSAHQLWASAEENLFVRQLFAGSQQCNGVRPELRYRRSQILTQ